MDFTVIENLQDRNGTRIDKVQTADGSVWARKTASDPNKQPDLVTRNQREHAANQIYELCGANPPETFLDESGALFKEYIYGQPAPYVSESKRYKGEIPEQLISGMAADVFLANWDVLESGNIILDEKGNARRIDAGGSLDFKAQKGRKNINDLKDVTELESMRFTPSINHAAHDNYGQVTNLELAARIKQMEPLRDKILGLIPNDIRPTFEARFNKMQSWADNPPLDNIDNFRAYGPSPTAREADIYDTSEYASKMEQVSEIKEALPSSEIVKKDPFWARTAAENNVIAAQYTRAELRNVSAIEKMVAELENKIVQGKIYNENLSKAKTELKAASGITKKLSGNLSVEEAEKIIMEMRSQAAGAGKHPEFDDLLFKNPAALIDSIDNGKCGNLGIRGTSSLNPFSYNKVKAKRKEYSTAVMAYTGFRNRTKKHLNITIESIEDYRYFSKQLSDIHSAERFIAQKYSIKGRIEGNDGISTVSSEDEIKRCNSAIEGKLSLMDAEHLH